MGQGEGRKRERETIAVSVFTANCTDDVDQLNEKENDLNSSRSNEAGGPC